MPNQPPSPMIALDLRPLLARGVDLLATILAAIEALPSAGVLLVEAPFEPAPLAASLTCRGHAVSIEALAPEHRLLEVVKGGAPTIEDLRDLEPPEPMERVLVAGAALAPGEVFLARLPRFPRMLVPRMNERALAYAILERPDGAALIRLARPA